MGRQTMCLNEYSLDDRTVDEKYRIMKNSAQKL